ncbi:MAG: hypothetical protein MZU95_12930 [Desulfomicrobium escambiense]|nr:hypothetical protein [Desulfomicrobium escambiense]
MPEDVDGLGDELSDDKMDQMFYSEGRLDLRAVVLEQPQPDLPGQAPVRGGLRGHLRRLRRDRPRRQVLLPGQGDRDPLEQAQNPRERQELNA